MGLLEKWREKAYNQNMERGAFQKLWDDYFQIEKGVYEKLLENPEEKVSGTVKELAEKYGLDTVTMAGFLDGINESLVKENPIEEMEEDTIVSLDFDNEKLYRNMVEARADWLYNLPQWEKIFDEETRERLYKDQRRSHTVVNDNKIGRNDPCPCGSGKKYKQCCGKKKAAANA